MITAAISLGEILSAAGIRHCPSAEIRALSNSPSALSSSVASGASNNGSGRQKSHQMKAMAETERLMVFLRVMGRKLG